MNQAYTMIEMCGMQFVVYFVVILVIGNTAGQGNPRDVRILAYDSVNNGADGYKFSYTLDDGTQRTESGQFVNNVWTVTGTVQWYSPDNQKYAYSYRADDKGVVWLPVAAAVPGPGVSVAGYGASLSSSSLASLAGVG